MGIENYDFENATKEIKEILGIELIKKKEKPNDNMYPIDYIYPNGGYIENNISYCHDIFQLNYLTYIGECKFIYAKRTDLMKYIIEKKYIIKDKEIFQNLFFDYGMGMGMRIRTGVNDNDEKKKDLLKSIGEYIRYINQIYSYKKLHIVSSSSRIESIYNPKQSSIGYITKKSYGRYFGENVNTLSKQLIKSFIKNKLCLLPCTQTDYNIFLWDSTNDLNLSSYKLLDGIGSSYLRNITFIKDGNEYFPEKVDFYIDGQFVKSSYGQLIKVNDKLHEMSLIDSYSFGSSGYLLSSDTKIEIRIEDSNQISQVLFYICYQEEYNPINHDLQNQLSNETDYLSLTNSHELIYEGIDSVITLNEFHGFFSDLYIVCEDLENQIKSISISNNDVQIIKNIPVSLLKYKDNICSYGFTINNSENLITSGFKIDEENNVIIELDKIKKDSEPESSVKIYGKKLILLENNISKHIYSPGYY